MSRIIVTFLVMQLSVAYSYAAGLRATAQLPDSQITVGAIQSVFAADAATTVIYSLYDSVDPNAVPCYSTPVPSQYYPGSGFTYSAQPILQCPTGVVRVSVSGGPNNSTCDFTTHNAGPSSGTPTTLQAAVLGYTAGGNLCLHGQAHSANGYLPVYATSSCPRCEPASPKSTSQHSPRKLCGLRKGHRT
jgi:hypothetical protein